MRRQRICVFAVAVLVLAATAIGQTKYPPETRNAALRYWFAFAEVQDPPADKATQDLLGNVAEGGAAWNEEKLGAILDENEAAILAMQRATKLPDCDWGLDYSAGPQASIAYAPRARVLGRLNTLYGIRMAAKGQMQPAVDSWLAGIRFSQDVAKGGTLIFALIGEAILLPNLRALAHEAQSKSLDVSQRKQVESAIRALPETAFDWGEAMRLEEANVYLFFDRMKDAPDPAAYYEAVMGQAPRQDFSLPSLSERAAYHKVMTSVESELRQPPDSAGPRLEMLQQQIQKMPPPFQRANPSFTRINEARTEIATSLTSLKKVLAGNWSH